MPLAKLEVVPVAEAIKPLPVPALPPYNGYGSLEDSEQSCKNLVGMGLFCATWTVQDGGALASAGCQLAELLIIGGAVGHADPPCCLIAWVCPATMCYTPVGMSPLLLSQHAAQSKLWWLPLAASCGLCQPQRP